MTKPKIWIFALEPIDSRYTAQWHKNIPEILDRIAGNNWCIRQIDGVQREKNVSAGAFLNFSDTNYWKSSQLCNFIDKFDAGETTINDRFLFTDGWNPAILQIKYMRDLLGMQWELHSIFHAGAYDPSDILGYRMEKPWPWEAERAMFHACDYNYFATDFHREMFLTNLGIETKYHHKAIRSGQPHTPIIQQCESAAAADADRINGMIWPHRYNDDKQPNIVEDMSKFLENQVLITQKLNLSKEQYYQTLGTCKVLFSCSLHENLGISVMEGVLAGVIPIVPDRCSYSEMYLSEFKYPSEWTSSYDNYLKHRDELVEFVNHRINNYHKYQPLLSKQKQVLVEKFLSPAVMVQQLIS